MVADEADRHDEERAGAVARPAARMNVAEVGADPRLGRAAGALVRDAGIGATPARSGDAARRRRDLVRVAVAGLDDARAAGCAP